VGPGRVQSKLRYFVSAGRTATLATLVVATALCLGIPLLVSLFDTSERTFVDIFVRTLRAVALLVPAVWLLVFVLDFGSVETRRRGGRRGRRGSR
jgi:ABC-type antimicrobial peptide transport system permease subunit